MKPKETIILSVGGSLIAPQGVSLSYLRKFVPFIRRNTDRFRFVLVIGGGGLAREYARAAKNLKASKDTDLDWIGIFASRLNAQLVRTLFKAAAHSEVITDPTSKPRAKNQVIVASGYKPGWSTDYVAVSLASAFKVKKVVNLTNTDYVYDRDPRKYKNAKPLTLLEWKNFQRLVGDKWRPGMNMPFDPIASRLAAKKKMQVVICNGADLQNLQKVFDDKPFRGTVII